MIRSPRPLLWCLALLLSAMSPDVRSTPREDGLRTVAEDTGFRETGRYGEVTALCRRFALSHPDAVRCQTFGTTPEGRPMVALVVSRAGALSAGAARARRLPVVLVQGGIHAGEIDGKDAGFIALRQLLALPAGQSPLARLVLVFVPVFNVDGHERFGHWNRPNQRGPQAMGWRTTAQNFNLNRDYAKVDSPEMRAMLALQQQWDPMVTVDLHVTDGAMFEHDVAIQVEPAHAGDEALRPIGRALRDGVIEDLTQQGSLPLPFYPSFVVEDDPTSGFADGVSPPRFSTGYFLLRNRLAMLVETHSWKDYATRVRITRNAIVSTVQRVASHGSTWRREALAADERAQRLAGQPVPLDYRATANCRTIDFRGYAYTRSLSDVSGALMTRYDERAPQVMQLPLCDEVVAGTIVNAPGAGYLVGPAHAGWLADKLRIHGVRFVRLARDMPPMAIQAFRASQATFSSTSTEGHQRLRLEGQWRDEQRRMPAGSLFVPMAQPRARLAMALLEPMAPDSFAAWGAFNNAFERKEYMEPYVAEDVAREQLAASASLRSEFESRLAQDAAFASDASARLDFFYRRHASWDDRFGLYPVYRTDHAPGPARR